jgi:hypothetical protein
VGLTEHDPEAGMRKAAAGRRSGPSEAEGRESGSSDAEGAPPLQAPGTHDPRRWPWLIEHDLLSAPTLSFTSLIQNPPESWFAKPFKASTNAEIGRRTRANDTSNCSHTSDETRKMVAAIP